MRTPWLLLGLAGALVVALGTPAQAQKPKKKPIELTVGDMGFRYDPDTGVQLSVFGIPMVKGSTLYFVHPRWEDRFYGQGDNPFLLDKAVVDSFQGGKRITLVHMLPEEYNNPVRGKEVITLFPDNTYSATLEFTFERDVPAWVEWGAARVNPAPFIGGQYVVQKDNVTTAGLVPAEAKTSGLRESQLAEGFDRVTLQSRIGEIRIESKAAEGLSLVDYRKNVYASEDNPLFWLGILEREIQPRKPYTFTVTIQFPRKLEPVSKTVSLTEARVDLRKTSEALVPNWGQDSIIPAPKRLQFGEGCLPLSARTALYVGEKPGEGIANALEFFLGDLKTLYGLELKVVRREALPAEIPDGAIVIGESSRFAVPAEVCSQAGLAIPKQEEGYALQVSPRGAFVAANTEKGVFYGLTTLLQLAQVTDQGISFKAAEVVDYPSLEFRGIHCLSGQGAGREIAKALRTLMARFKINTLVWECEYLIWDGHKDIAHPQYGMTKKDARQVVDAAGRNFIEIIPLIQSLGHCEWVFQNKQNLDLAEDPATPYALNPTNPDSYTFLFDIYAQAIELFHPRRFHIGMDEVTMRGRFPYKSKDSGKSVGELTTDHVAKVHAWLKERDIRPMMWGDMFLFRDEATDARFAPTLEEAKKRRAALPRDVMISDWHYTPEKPEGYTSIKVWKDEGFEVAGAGWDNTTNIRNLAQACVLAGAAGYLQTTWAGFNFKIDGNESQWRQYWSYILAAHYAWSGDATPVRQLPFSAREKFLDVWLEKKPLLEKRAGSFVDLRPVANRKLEDDAAGSGWVGIGPDTDFSSFPMGKLRAGETQFDMSAQANGRVAVLFAGKFNPPGTFPETVRLSLEPAEAEEIHFLMNSSCRTAEKAKAGEIVITYANGAKESMDLVYGANLFAFNDTRVGREARIAWEGKTRGDKVIHVWDVAWKNPRPGKKIQSLEVRSTGTEASPVLFAVTLVSPRS